MFLNSHVPVRSRMNKYISVEYKLNWIFHFIYIEKIMMIFFLAYQYFVHSQLKKKSNLVENKCWITHSCLMYTYPNVHACILLHVLVTRGFFYYLCDWYFWQAVFRMYKVQQWWLWSRDQRSRCPSQTPRENQGAYEMVTWHEVQIWIWEGT